HDDDGNIRRTDWVNWSDVELNTIRHHLVGRRGGYVTNKLYGPLSQNRGDLLSTQRDIAGDTEPGSPPSWDKLRARLVDDGNTPASAVAVRAFLRYDRAATRLAGDVLAARWPDRVFTAVRFRLRSQPVVPFESRNVPAGQREQARPDPNVTTGGWREP